jgi:hypothetical protein
MDSPPVAVARSRVLRTELKTDAQLWEWREAMILEVASLLSVSRIVSKRLLVDKVWDTGFVKSELADQWFSGKRNAILQEIGEGEGEGEVDSGATGVPEMCMVRIGTFRRSV